MDGRITRKTAWALSWLLALVVPVSSAKARQSGAYGRLQSVASIWRRVFGPWFGASAFFLASLSEFSTVSGFKVKQCDVEQCVSRRRRSRVGYDCLLLFTFGTRLELVMRDDFRRDALVLFRVCTTPTSSVLSLRLLIGYMKSTLPSPRSSTTSQTSDASGHCIHKARKRTDCIHKTQHFEIDLSLYYLIFSLD